jgi:hypothetical protein
MVIPHAAVAKLVSCEVPRIELGPDQMFMFSFLCDKDTNDGLVNICIPVLADPSYSYYYDSKSGIPRVGISNCGETVNVALFIVTVARGGLVFDYVRDSWSAEFEFTDNPYSNTNRLTFIVGESMFISERENVSIICIHTSNGGGITTKCTKGRHDGAEVYVTNIKTNESGKFGIVVIE